MPKDTYQSILQELKELNKQIASLNKKVKAEKSNIAKRKDSAKAENVRKKIKGL